MSNVSEVCDIQEVSDIHQVSGIHEDSDIHYDCAVCFVPHDDEIHDATLRVRSWLNRELTRKLSTNCDPAQEFMDPAFAEIEPALAMEPTLADLIAC
jgi:hypothetical protein